LVLVLIPLVEASFYISDTLEEGASKILDINGVSINITVIAISDTGDIIAKFRVNEETTSSISAGNSDKLDDGTELLVREIIPNEAGDPTLDLVRFVLFSSSECGDDVCNIDENCGTCSTDCGECEEPDAREITSTQPQVPIRVATTTTTESVEIIVPVDTTTPLEQQEKKGFFQRLTEWIKRLFGFG